MALVRHVGILIWESVRFGAATGRLSVPATIILGLLLFALTLTAKAAAPVALYPFA